VVFWLHLIRRRESREGNSPRLIRGFRRESPDNFKAGLGREAVRGPFSPPVSRSMINRFLYLFILIARSARERPAIRPLEWARRRAVRYFADTPDGAWAGSRATKASARIAELAGIRRSMWAIVLPDHPAPQTPHLPPPVVAGGTGTYAECRKEARRPRAKGARWLGFAFGRADRRGAGRLEGKGEWRFAAGRRTRRVRAGGFWSAPGPGRPGRSYRR
jgi:hypothetical protein